MQFLSAALRQALDIFDALPERWGLLYCLALSAAASAELGDWPQVVILLGVIDSLDRKSVV